MTATAHLTATQQRRLARLAEEAGCEPQDLLADVFKYGIDWVEADVRETLAGVAEALAGDTVTGTAVEQRIERILKAEDGRKQRQAA